MKEYKFVLAENKVIAQENIKKHTSITKQIWRLFQDENYSFYGATRDWTAVFGRFSQFWTIHHFIDEKPEHLMIDSSSGLCWQFMFPEESVIYRCLSHLANNGFTIIIPEGH